MEKSYFCKNRVVITYINESIYMAEQKKAKLNGFLEVILWLNIMRGVVSDIPGMFLLLIRDFSVSSIIMVGLTLCGLIGVWGILKIKRWGLFMLMGSIILGFILGLFSTELGGLFLTGLQFARFIFWSCILCLSKDGYSAWTVLNYDGDVIYFDDEEVEDSVDQTVSEEGR